MVTNDEFGDQLSAARLHALAGYGPTRLNVSLQRLFATDREGNFLHPAKQLADMFWMRPIVIRNPPAETLAKSTVVALRVFALGTGIANRPEPEDGEELDDAGARRRNPPLSRHPPCRGRLRGVRPNPRRGGD
jgi:hypothetical protein